MHHVLVNFALFLLLFFLIVGALTLLLCLGAQSFLVAVTNVARKQDLRGDSGVHTRAVKLVISSHFCGVALVAAEAECAYVLLAHTGALLDAAGAVAHHV